MSLQSAYKQATLRQANRIVTDPSHVLHTEYQLLLSGRRFRVPRFLMNKGFSLLFIDMFVFSVCLGTFRTLVCYLLTPLYIFCM